MRKVSWDDVDAGAIGKDDGITKDEAVGAVKRAWDKPIVKIALAVVAIAAVLWVLF